MKNLRVSIAGLMALIVLLAVGFAALKNPSELRASAAFTLMVGSLLLALLGVAFRRGDKQLFWAGFAVFGWGYLVLVLSTGALKPPALLSSLFIAHLNRVLSPPVVVITGYLNGPPALPALPFFQIGHSLAALVVALLGTLLARIFARQEESAPIVSDPPESE